MSNQPNQDQSKFWNSEGGAQWVENQALIDQNLAVFVDALMEKANIETGMQVLDIGCGCGGSTLKALEAGANITGLDISTQMIERAKQRATEVEGEIEFLVADAMTYQWEKQYDLIISRFGVMFFDDPVFAFSNLLSALRPGGRICFICWQSPQENPWISVPMSAVRPYLPPAEPGKPNSPGMFGLADPEYTKGILADAGFQDIVCEDTRLDNQMADGTVDGTVQFMTDIGPLRSALANMDGEVRNSALRDMRQALSENTTDGKVHLGAGCWLVSASRPG